MVPVPLLLALLSPQSRLPSSWETHITAPVFHTTSAHARLKAYVGPQIHPCTQLMKKQFAARPAGFQCSPASTSIIQSYCDAADPYCCTGNDANTHQQYVNKYGSQALAFIKSKITA